MAKVQNPLLSLRASGSVGDLTFGFNQYGPWVRPKTTPQTPDSEDQQWQQYMFSIAVDEWNNRTSDERKAWDDLAKSKRYPDALGIEQQISGRLLYIKCYINAYQIMVGLGHRPARPFTNDYWPTLTLSQDNDGIWLTPGSAPNTYQGIIIKGCAPQLVTRNSLPSTLFKVGYLNSTTDNPLLLVANADLSVDVSRYFFQLQCVGANAFVGPKRVKYIDAQYQEIVFNLTDTYATYGRNTNPTTDYSGQSVCDVVYESSAHHVSWYKFDLSSLSSYTSCSSAILTLTLTSTEGLNSSDTMRVSALLQDWVQGQATWNIYSTGNSWNTAGSLGIGSDVSDTYYIDESMSGHSVGDTFVVDITDIVNAWLDSTIENYGIAIWWNTLTFGNYRIFGNHRNATPSYRPDLEITI